MPSKHGFGNSRTPMTKKVSYGSPMHYKNPVKMTAAQETLPEKLKAGIRAKEAKNPITKKETLPGIDAKLDAKTPIRQSEQEETVTMTVDKPVDPAEIVKKSAKKINIGKSAEKILSKQGTGATDALSSIN